jgi:site-specific DNA-methyltransferase (adenine-specific)
MQNIELINGDCLEYLRNYKGDKFNLVILDLPYGITACEWDKKINLNELWELMKKNCYHNTIYIFFCTAKFGYEIIKSNEPYFRYDLIWKKKNSVGFLNCGNQPLRKHENIYIFSNPYPSHNKNTNKELREYAKNVYEFIGKTKKQIFKELGNYSTSHFFHYEALQFGIPTKKTYNSLIEIYNIDKMENFIQYEELKKKFIKLQNKKKYNSQKIKVKEFKHTKQYEGIDNSVYNNNINKTNIKTKKEIRDYRNPTSILTYGKDEKKNLHPTQKPIELIKFLIKTYSDKGDFILDPTMGCGTTGRACLDTERRFLGIEKNKEIYDIAEKSIQDHKNIIEKYEGEK